MTTDTHTDTDTLLDFFEHADSLLGRLPGLRSLGDHVLVRLQREIDGTSTAQR